MPQISLYIDKDTLTKIEKVATKEKISISKWVGRSVKEFMKENYPPGYFDLFGSLSDESFHVEKLSFKQDSKRESL